MGLEKERIILNTGSVFVGRKSFKKKSKESVSKEARKEEFASQCKRAKKEPYGKGLTCPQFQLEYDSTWGFSSFLSHTGITMEFCDFSYVRVRSDFCVRAVRCSSWSFWKFRACCRGVSVQVPLQCVFVKIESNICMQSGCFIFLQVVLPLRNRFVPQTSC